MTSANCSASRTIRSMSSLLRPRRGSRPFLASILSLAWASSSANCSASRTIRSMSSLLRRPLSLVMVMLAFLPDADLSSAVTLSTPLASTSKVTSTWGTPRGAGGMPPSSNFPRRLLSLVRERSPSYTWMVVSVGGESLRLLGGDGGVAGNQGGHDASSSFETHRKWGNVEQQNVLVTSGATSQNVGLDSSTVCNSLVRVDGAAWLLAVEVVGDQLLHLGDTGGATDEHNLVDGALVGLGILEHLLDWVEGATEEVGAEVLEASTGDGRVEVNALVQRVNLDLSVGGCRKVALGTLTGGTEATHGAGVAGEVLLVLALELLHEVVDHPVVKVLSTKVSVASSSLDLKDAIVDGEQRHIKGATTKVEDEHVALASGLLVETVCDSGGGGLVDDTHHVKPGNGASVLGSLTLGVVEVGGHGDHHILDGLASEGLAGLLHLVQHHRGDLLGGEGLLLALEVDGDVGLVAVLGDHLEGPVLHVGLHDGIVEFAADEALGVEHRVGGVHCDLVLGGVADETLGVGEGDVARGGAVALIIRDDLHAVVLPDADARVGGSKVNAESGSS